MLFRAHPLDGAMLYFHPPTGTHVRVEAPATAGLRRSSPRVVMFGITNACNLRCTYCSRDPSRESLWTVDAAVEVLGGLATAGALEVALGGGEPFAFRGLFDLVRRLRAETSLAVHVTTNGTLLDDALLARFGGLFGQVRLSLHDRPEANWRLAAGALSRAGQRWGRMSSSRPRCWRTFRRSCSSSRRSEPATSRCFPTSGPRPRGGSMRTVTGLSRRSSARALCPAGSPFASATASTSPICSLRSPPIAAAASTS